MSAQHVSACLSLVSLFGLTGCAVHPPTQLYQLDVSAIVVPKEDGGAAVLLGSIQSADYLKRDVMIQRQADDILSLSIGARWAGNLETNISQQLLRQMSSELNSSYLVLFPEKPGFAPQVQVMLIISRLDSGPKQPAMIEACWRLLDQKGDLKDSRVFYEEERHQDGIGDQVCAQSDPLKRLAAQLAKDVRLVAVTAEVPPPAAVCKPMAKPRVEEKGGLRMPLAVPVRTDAEVYRL